MVMLAVQRGISHSRTEVNKVVQNMRVLRDTTPSKILERLDQVINMSLVSTCSQNY